MSTDELEIVEGINSVWHYHLRMKGQMATLCNNMDVMSTLIPLTYWGQKADYIPENYCKLCAEMREERADE